MACSLMNLQRHGYCSSTHAFVITKCWLTPNLYNIRTLCYQKAVPCQLCYFFPGLFFNFIFIFAHSWWFGFGVLDWVFVVGVFSWWGFVPVVWGLLGFFGEGALYVNIEKKPGKNFASNIVSHRPQLVMSGKSTKSTLVCLSQTLHEVSVTNKLV